jgi:diamine N-acetyltransferase
VWLGVWEHNPRAIRFYQRLGFAEVGDHVFVVGTDPQRDLVMIRILTA